MWSNRGQRFDALSLTLKRGNWNWNLFAGSLVRALPGRLDQVRYTHRISGLYGRWSPQASSWDIQPFVLWKYAPQSDESGGPDGWRSEWTSGVNATKDIGRGFSLYGELALQYGTAVHRPLRAWAAARELRHPLPVGKHSQFSVGLAEASGNRGASGDRATRNSPRGTFDDLYPAAFNSCGFLVPFAWRNIRDLHAGGNWDLKRNWSLASELHSYWLNSRSDGVYADEETWVFRNPEASSSRLGVQWSTLLAYRHSAHWNAGVGYAHFFAGPYLRESAAAASANGAFLSFTWTP
ncbi:MAG TPA: alginate export family protein [Bryobacteraceae bacterium]|nr:alginate export family protein [Bryobacteraceae bacterium]